MILQNFPVTLGIELGPLPAGTLMLTAHTEGDLGGAHDALLRFDSIQLRANTYA